MNCAQCKFANTTKHYSLRSLSKYTFNESALEGLLEVRKGPELLKRSIGTVLYISPLHDAVFCLHLLLVAKKQKLNLKHYSNRYCTKHNPV